MDFAATAIRFFKDLTSGNGFVFDTTSNMADLNEERLKGYQLLMMINDFPHSPSQRSAFEKYMQDGGGWMGFHVAGYTTGQHGGLGSLIFWAAPFFTATVGRRCRQKW